MSEDPAIYEPEINLNYLNIAVDYLLGLKYSEIQVKYGVNRWGIQNALHKAGVETNRIESGARFGNGQKKRKFSEELIKRMKENTKVNNKYFERKRHLHCTMGNSQDNNPVLVDDLDYMERVDEYYEIDNYEPALQYEIEVTEEDERKYKGK